MEFKFFRDVFDYAEKYNLQRIELFGHIFNIKNIKVERVLNIFAKEYHCKHCGTSIFVERKRFDGLQLKVDILVNKTGFFYFDSASIINLPNCQNVIISSIIE